MEYAHPEVLVDTQWVADNFKDSGKVRIAEVDYDPRLFKISTIIDRF
jgi:thiosulfate/3-mercaptopyruvate sulfurtransferase